MDSPMNHDRPNLKSRTSSAYASTAARPRAKRFITGLEEFSETLPPPEQHNNVVASPSPAASTISESPFFSRAPSPIPKQHPSRSSSLKPPTRRQASQRPENGHAGNGELGTALSGLWGKSWTSLQELASNVLGSDATTEPIKDNPRTSRRPTPNGSRPPNSRDRWGPSGRGQSQPGGGSHKERSELVRAMKREELLSAGANGYSTNPALNHKRRTSDDFGSTSAPPGESDDRDTLVYIHNVSPRDTMAGISIKYNCQLMIIKRTNRLWSNDGIQARKTLTIPVDACSVRGKRVAGPGESEQDFLTGDATCDERSSLDTDGMPDLARRPSSTITITPSNIESLSKGFAQSPTSTSESSEPTKTTEDTSDPWVHDHWVLLDGQTEKTEIARLSRSNLGYFPRAKRKSAGSISSLERSSTSLDIPTRPSITVSDTSSSQTSLHRSRRSSTSNQFASQMFGPGGVGNLKGRGPSTPGPAEDKLTKALKKVSPAKIRIPGAPVLGSSYNSEDEFYNSSYGVSAAPTPGFNDLGNAFEGWAKKVGKGIAKAFDAPPTTSGSVSGINGTSSSKPRAKHMAPREERGGYSATMGGDLIELAQAFEIGDDGEEDVDPERTPRPYESERGRRGSFDAFGGPRLDAFGAFGNGNGGGSRSRSHGPRGSSSGRKRD